MTEDKHKARFGFTLVELLVVVGIIGVLVALLLPAMAAVRRTAKTTTTRAKFTSIEAGLETYRNDTGEPYPPSSSDNPNDPNLVNSPYDSSDPELEISVPGATLLLWALAGADLLGTPGFQDYDRDGTWWDDTHSVLADDGADADGLYALSDAGREPVRRRYGTYIDLEKADIMNLSDYAEDHVPTGAYPAPAGDGIDPDSNDPRYNKVSFILDGFDQPILYYKASVGASQMVTTCDQELGVYSHWDNRMLTGQFDASGDTFACTGFSDSNLTGIDLGAGQSHGLLYIPDGDVSPDPDDLNLQADVSTDTFIRYLWDSKVTARNEPVRKDSFILISAGPDALYGTADDITNFSKETK